MSDLDPIRAQLNDIETDTEDIDSDIPGHHDLKECILFHVRSVRVYLDRLESKT